jgi:hypothetical protein
MEVYYNELSHKPIVNTSDEARQRILTLLSTMQSLRELNFTFLRIHNNFYESPIGIGYMVVDFLSDPNVARWQKTLLQTIARNPFIPNEDSPEAEMFLMHGFQTLDHEGTLVSPEGMAAAYVHGRPTLSISSHAFWQKSPLVLNVTANPSFASQEEVMNFWSTDSVEAWKSSLPAEKVVEIPLDSKENIKGKVPRINLPF